MVLQLTYIVVNSIQCQVCLGLLLYIINDHSNYNYVYCCVTLVFMSYATFVSVKSTHLQRTLIYKEHSCHFQIQTRIHSNYNS